MSADDAPYKIRELSTNECWETLRGSRIGRLAVIVDGHPEIFPVNYVVDHGTVVFRTAAGSKLEGALAESGVAFEVDGFDPASHEAWSAIVKGGTEQLHGVEDMISSEELHLTPWQAGDKSHFVRVVPTEVSGRRFRVAPGDLPRHSISRAGHMLIE